MGQPRRFFDNSWLAVRSGTVEAMVGVLDLSDPVAATWDEGLSAVLGDYWDFDAPEESFLSRIFVTPEVAGWRLAVGGWLGGGSPGGPTLDEVAGYCCTLSRRFGAAHAFTEQGRMDWFQWILARNGSVDRLYSWDGESVRDEGTPDEVERRIREEAGDGSSWTPSIGDVGAIAGHFSIDPDQLDSYPPGGDDGFLAITRWGRSNGVPRRPLTNARR